MALSVDQPNSAVGCAAWNDLDALWADFSADGHLPEIAASASSATGQTWNGALAVPMRLAPGETRTVRFLLAWHFPNRTVNYSQRPFFGFADECSTFWLGNRYNTWYRSALDVVADVATREEELVGATRLARDTFYDSSLPRALIDTVTSQLSIARSPTCFWTEDGAFYGFEGCNGQSTGGHTEPWGGSCPLNCTHVWNYEMSLARLFPDLERSMRETEWFIQQHPTGYLPHRVLLPTYLPRPWGSKIGGPNNPALDGLLGAILKTYREYLTSGDRAWLAKVWPHLKQALDHVWTAHDPERSGIILGEQPNTYDISIYGANTFIGTLYLAALRVMETVAEVFGESELAAECRRVFSLGQVENESLWNGEFYEQRVDLNDWPEQNWATGCHADHLLGQWWATILGLGDLLDPERLATAASSIFRHNFRQDFYGIEQRPRQFVTDLDQGLLMCSWPRGGRPEVPTLYSDEVWTGIEYEVAALLLQTGAYDQAMEMVNAVRRRYDGRKQSPWNDIECGDHYARAMSSWSLLDSAMGYLFDAARQHLTVAPVVPDSSVHAPFFTRDGWGTAKWQRDETGIQVALTVRSGSVTLASVGSNASGATTVSVAVDGGTVESASIRAGGKWSDAHFAKPIHLTVGQTLEVRFGE
jgi:non-lysosomal glucosylceramidase